MTTTPQELLASLSFAYPLCFETDDDDYPVRCSGTCFAVTFREKLFIVTATHCFHGYEGTPIILGPGKRRFPVKQVDHVGAEEPHDWTDVSIISTYEKELWPLLDTNTAFGIDELIQSKISAKPGAFLTFVGYPRNATEVEVDPYRVIRAPSPHLGRYGGPSTDAHCHILRNFEPQIDDPDGFSGSPVLLLDITPSGITPKLVGMVTRGGKGSQVLRFIGLDILILALKSLDQQLMKDP